MILIKVGEWYFHLDRLIKAGPGGSPGALKMVTDRGDATELVGQDADDMRTLLDRYASPLGSAGTDDAVPGTDRDPATGKPNP